MHVKPHKVFGRTGDNLTLKVPVTFPEAALGAEIKVPIHKGQPVTVRIPAGTPNGRVLRVRGQGAPRRDGTKGDLLVTVDVQVPTEIDETSPRGPGEDHRQPQRRRRARDLLRMAREE